MTERQSCLIVDRAVNLAKLKGLDPSSVFCPLIQICDGTTCMFNEPEISKEDTKPIAVEHFYQRLEKKYELGKYKS